MREIKFRAWDDDEKKMRLVHSIQFALNIKTNERVVSSDAGNSEDDMVFGEFPLMQFTGLKDKNGKEIYEGDIVSGGGFTKYTIKWDRIGWYPFTNTTWAADLLEVVGNIYSNPELVKKYA